MSIIRPQQRLHLARILIAVLAPVVVAGLVPAAAGAGGPQGGSKGHHLEFRLSGRDHQDILGAGVIAFNALCPTESCTVVASATSKSPSIHSATVHAHVAAGKAKSISLPVAKRQRGKLKAALEAGKTPILKIKAIARDKSGNRIPLSFEVRAFKP